MSSSEEKSRPALRYILGDMLAEERARFEEEYFENDELFEELVAAENEIADKYVRGKLSSAERQKVEQHFLHSSERKKEIEFAGLLMEAVNNPILKFPGHSKFKQ